jgi:hypothetical protein
MTKISKPIQPVKYSRDKQGVGGEVIAERYGGWTLDEQRAKWLANAIEYGENMVLYRGNIGEVFVSDDAVHVSESLYRTHPIMVLREYVLECLVDMQDADVISGLELQDTSVVKDGPE